MIKKIEKSEKPEKSWQTKIKQFASEFNLILSANPDWTREQISTFLKIDPRIVRRMLEVYRHMDDPKVSKSLTLKQAFAKIKTLHETKTFQGIEEITNISNSIFPKGKE